MVETKIGKLKVLFLAVLAVIFVMVYAPGQTHAAAGINQQISFEGKIVTASGVNVPDGTYNLEFKIYQDGTGCVSGGTSPCGGTLKWTEDRLVSASQGVTVTAGTFQVNLGAITAFGTNIDWNQSALWLSMNVGGTGTTASWDGEMTPFIRLTAVPYALNAGTVGGLSASQLVQLQTGTITNQTGGLGVTGNVQAGGTVSALTVTQNGNSVCDASSNCNNYIINGTGAQTGNFNISGTGIAGALQVASGGTIDSTSLGTLNIGTTSGTSTVNIGKATQNVVLPGTLYLNGATTANSRIVVLGTETSSITTSQYGIQNQMNFAPSGASLTSLYALLNIPLLTTSSTPITSAYGNLSRIDTVSSYTGQITNAIAFDAGTPSLAGTNPITNYYGVKVENNNANVGVSGNTVTNYGISTYTPGANSAYTTNYGLYIQGNGGASATNYSLYNASTAQSYFAGSIQSAGSLTVGSLVINSSGVVTAGTWNGATLTPGYGGTGQSSYAVGDLLYASAATTLSKLSDVATGQCLISGGVGVAPTWGSCGSAGANTALSNLASTAVNASIIPGSSFNNLVDLGSSSYGFRSGYFGTSVITPSVQSASGANLAVDTAGANTLNLGNANATTINLGMTAGTTAQTVNIAGGGGNNTVNISTGAGTNAINIGSPGDTLTFNAGATTGTLGASGAGFQSVTNSTSAFQVQNAAGVPVFLVDTSTSLSGNYLTYGGFEVGTTTPTGWSSFGSPTTYARNTASPNHYGGQASLQIVSSASGQGATTTTFSPTPTNQTYTVSFYALNTAGVAMTSASFSTVVNGGAAAGCYGGVTLSASGFQRVVCPIASAAVTSLTIEETSGASTFYIDAVQMIAGTTTTPPPATNGAIQLRGAIDSPVVFQALSNSTTAFQIQNTAGNSNLFVADTLNARIGIGTNAPATALDVNGTGLRVGGTLTAENPTDGALYLGKFGGTNRVIFANATTPQEIDNLSGTFRIFSPLNTELTIDGTSGNTTIGKSLIVTNASTLTGSVQIGSATASTTGTLLTLNNYSNGTTEPTEVNGAMYYNSALGAFRCGIAGAWRNCANGIANSVTTTNPISTMAVAAGTIYIVPIYIPGQITVNQIHVGVQTALGTAGDAGLYNSNGTLVLNGGSSSVTTTTGAKSITPTQAAANRVLEPGQYYAAVTTNTATGALESGTALTATFGVGVIPRLGTLTGGGLVLPASITLTSITASGSVPSVSFNN